ncbi:hypothetical protein [Aestuariivivens insulae]|uniref:hypothetical protein n=1 Tax=Aestuariivivens insulae TaxID=1621988 RepID=UPI001F56F75D|nr:hypothetical protein [Aestuariivivens insulae]
MERRTSVRRIMLDLLYIKEQVKEKFKDNKNYMEILNYLDKEDYLDDDIPLPSFKQIEQDTRIKSYHIRKRLIDMYNILFSSDEDVELDFKSSEIYFYLQNNKEYASFKCKKLNYIPRIGENMDLPFIKEKVGCDYFYVDDIRHYYYSRKQTIYIYLKSGMFNSYWYTRLHEAEEKKELPFKDFYNLSDWELKRRLLFKKP